MTIRLSSALRTAVITNYGLGMMLNGGQVRLYTGTPPDSADAPAIGTLLGKILFAGAGLNIKAGPDAGSLVNDGAWDIEATANGTVGWWRWVMGADTGSSTSLTDIRMDGTRADGFGADAFPAMVAGVTSPINSLLITFP